MIILLVGIILKDGIANIDMVSVDVQTCFFSLIAIYYRAVFVRGFSIVSPVPSPGEELILASCKNSSIDSQ